MAQTGVFQGQSQGARRRAATPSAIVDRFPRNHADTRGGSTRRSDDLWLRHGLFAGGVAGSARLLGNRSLLSLVATSRRSGVATACRPADESFSRASVPSTWKSHGIARVMKAFVWPSTRAARRCGPTPCRRLRPSPRSPPRTCRAELLLAPPVVGAERASATPPPAAASRSSESRPACTDERWPRGT